MADFSLSPNMQLPVPVTGVAPGPEWADLLNACMAKIDGHDHTPGLGVKITPSGLNISADLPLNANNLTLTRSVQFLSQGAPIPDLASIYVNGVDLYFNDLSGNPVRITQFGGVVGTPGSISGLIAPASASYVALSAAYVWQSAANISANMDIGSLILRNNTIGSFGLTLAPPVGMAADSTITLPVIPGVTSTLLMDNTGAMTTQDALQSYLPPGVVMDYMGATVPAGWLSTDGTAVSRTVYAALFAAINTIYGPGDGVTTFNLPNLNGLVTAGAPGALGGLATTGGAYTHTLTIAEMPSHIHTDGPGHTHNINLTQNNANNLPLISAIGSQNGGNNAPNITSNTHVTIDPTGGGVGHNNIQPYMAVNKIIKI